MQALGWAAIQDSPGETSVPWEKVGGPFGGAWHCSYDGGAENRKLELTFSKAPVPVERLRDLGRPAKAAGRPAFFSPAPKPEHALVNWFPWARLAVHLADGRILVLQLTDPSKDERASERALIELATVAVSRIPPA